MRLSSVPRVVLTYGLLGLIPFLVPPLIGSVAPAHGDWAAAVLALYGALILSFLGGARWGLTVGRPATDALVVSLAMLPALAGLALLLLPSAMRQAQLLALAGALALHWLWDMRGEDVPAWYPSLRTPLSAGAVLGLLAGAFVLT
jgi:ribose/xylose/arabinose/galactoside ABC-type transport system permease subunit